MPSKTIIQLRRDTAANWTTTNPVLAAGEKGVETDTTLFKIGDGTSTWTALGYANVLPTDSRLSDARTPLAHTHTIANVTNLQTTLDAKAVAGSNGVPYVMSAGQASMTGNGTAVQTATVTFPSSRFNFNPRISVTSPSSTLHASYSGLSTSGMTVSLRHVDNATWSSAQTVDWIAIQMTSGQASG